MYLRVIGDAEIHRSATAGGGDVPCRGPAGPDEQGSQVFVGTEEEVAAYVAGTRDDESSGFPFWLVPIWFVPILVATLEGRRDHAHPTRTEAP